MTKVSDPQTTAEMVARSSYGKLLSILTARTGDLAASEDALAGAFEKALTNWPRDGVPNIPEAWLLTVARRKLIDTARHEQVKAQTLPALQMMLEEITSTRITNIDADFGDDRLKLLFVCTHPAIDENIHTPLMLQTVLGLDAGAIASAFLIKATTMSQQLARAKQKIRRAGIAFSIPEKEHLEERIEAVLGAIYVVFTQGWDDAPQSPAKEQPLITEAIWLGHLLVKLLPNQPEAKGLLALMLYSQSRQHARRSQSRDYIPLEQQDTALWDFGKIEQAEALLSIAAIAKHRGAISWRRPFNPYTRKVVLRERQIGQRLFRFIRICSGSAPASAV